MPLPRALPEPALPALRGGPGLRWGVLAPGAIARKFAEALHTHTDQRIHAVGSRSLPRAVQFASEFGVGRAHGDYLSLVGDSGIDAVYIAPPSASEETLDDVARTSRGYVYAVSRAGVTGTETESSTVGLAESVARLREDAAAPVMLGFGISRPEHVAEAIGAGADGAISGSATVKIIEAHAAALLATEPGSTDREREVAALSEELAAFVASMKDATRR